MVMIMKKIIIVLAIIMIFLVNIKSRAKGNFDLEIPLESIRIRIIANSNSITDQYEKITVQKEVQTYLNTLLKNVKTKLEAQSLIETNLEKINLIVDRTLKNINSKSQYVIKYGQNHFPPKRFKGYDYQDGYYESLVITLGSGQGNNWWCVLFPPLCLMETDAESMSDIEYKLFIQDVISKYK